MVPGNDHALYTICQSKNTGAVITFNDITELKRTQLELDEKNKSLLRINLDLDHFIHAASHDLLAPLCNIETTINMIHDEDTSEEDLPQLLDVINLSVKKFRVLITDIAVIGKVESDMVKMERIDVADLLDNIEWSLEDKIKLTGTVITRDIGVNLIPFSKKNLRSILFNLVANAIKFKSNEPPAIHIQTTQEENNIKLVVSDNGRGIPQAGLGKIFDMYGRLNQDIEGKGIGLYLAKKIIDAVGGNIVVESEVGKGSKFIIYLKNKLPV